MAWSKKEQEQREAGRPAVYSDELANTICALLAEGMSLKAVCELEGMPTRSTVFKWIHEDTNGFMNKYARAKEESSDAFAEKMMEIAEEADVKNGNAIQKARLQIDTMKWLMSKQKPKKYGDKLDLTSDGKALPTPIYGGKSGESTKD